MDTALIKKGDWVLLKRKESEKRKFAPLYQSFKAEVVAFIRALIGRGMSPL